MVVREFVHVTVEAVGDRDASSIEIYRFDIPGEGLYSPEQLAKRIHDRVRFKIACRDLVQHRREQKVVVASHQSDAYIRAGAQCSFQFNRGVYATEPATEYEDPVGANCAARGILGTPASLVMIFSLIQLIRPCWNRRNQRIVLYLRCVSGGAVSTFPLEYVRIATRIE
jgi:hypothetical protein